MLGVDDKSGVVTELANTSEGRTITALAKNSDTEIFIGTDKGYLYTLDLERNLLVLSKEARSEFKASITALSIFESRIWVGTTSGLFSFDRKLSDPISYHYNGSELSHDHVTVFAEVGKELFVGTYDGLNQIGNTLFQNRDSFNSGVYNDVMSFELDSRKNLWVGTFGGLFYSEATHNEHEIVRVSPDGEVSPDNRIMSLEAVGDTLWIGTWNEGVKFIDLSSRRFLVNRIPELGRSSVTKILKKDNKEVWVATFDRGLWRILDDSAYSYPELENSSVTGLASDGEKIFLAFTERDIYQLDQQINAFTKLDIQLPNEITGVTIFTLTVIDPNTFIIGTKEHGALLLEGDSIRGSFYASRFGGELGIPNISVYAILGDKDSGFWVSTNSGVFKLNGSGEITQRYGRSQGLNSVDFNFGAHFYGNNGFIYFGGVKGYAYFDPSMALPQDNKPKFVLYSAKIDKTSDIGFNELKNLNDIVMSSANKSLVLHFNVLDYEDPFHNKFKYKLQGFDPDWIDNGTNNKATYTSLPAGDYTFMAKGANAAGVWSEDNVSLRIKVLPPWWLTQWAYAFYTLCALCVVWGAMRVYRTKLLRQEAERRADEMHALADTVRDELQESQELQDGLVQSAYRHNTATIDLIKQISAVTAQSSGDDGLSGHLAAMEVLEKSYYFENAALAANLHEYIDGLCNLLLPRASVDPATISIINLSTNSLIPAPVATPLAIILYELIDNALQHAFTARSAANFIQISLELKPATSSTIDTLTVIVQDDGIGLPSGLNVQAAPSKGFRVINALCGRLGGKLDVGLDSGTMISVCLPLYEETARYSN